MDEIDIDFVITKLSSDEPYNSLDKPEIRLEVTTSKGIAVFWGNKVNGRRNIDVLLGLKNCLPFKVSCQVNLPTENQKKKYNSSFHIPPNSYLIIEFEGY